MLEFTGLSILQINVQHAAHDEALREVMFTVKPSVCRTVRASRTRQLSLPLSSSRTNRTPTPATPANRS